LISRIFLHGPLNPHIFIRWYLKKNRSTPAWRAGLHCGQGSWRGEEAVTVTARRHAVGREEQQQLDNWSRCDGAQRPKLEDRKLQEKGFGHAWPVLDECWSADGCVEAVQRWRYQDETGKLTDAKSTPCLPSDQLRVWKL
jgi:hypothetical protein